MSLKQKMLKCSLIFTTIKNLPYKGRLILRPIKKWNWSVFKMQGSPEGPCSPAGARRRVAVCGNISETANKKWNFLAICHKTYQYTFWWHNWNPLLYEYDSFISLPHYIPTINMFGNKGWISMFKVSKQT